MTSAATRRPRPAEGPLCQTIMETLRREITLGRLAVGDRLPSEHELGARFGVSRHTAREALRRLQDIGLIVRRQGSGSVVAASRPEVPFNTSISTIEELVQYAASSRLEVLAVEKILVEGETAALLRSSAEAPWLRISALRRAHGDEPPLAYTEVFLPAEYADVARDIGSFTTAVYAIVESRHGVRIDHVAQTLAADRANANLASRLDIEIGSPVLFISRHYFDRDRRVVEVALSWHPAERYRYEMTLHRASDGR